MATLASSPLFGRFPASFVRLTGALLVSLLLVGFSSAADTPKTAFDIPADSAEKSLRRFSQQSGLEVVFPSGVAKDVRTRPVKGDMPAREALDTMLADTGLVIFRDEKTGAFSVRKETPDEAKNGSSRPASDRAADGGKVEDGTLKLDTFEVMGTKLLNMDIKRSRDDVQPYVIFDRSVIERSGASTIGDFLKQRLPMNTTALTDSALSYGFMSGASQVNLRGLGTNQTLILVDGHRMPLISFVERLGQPSVDGIPLAAIERIEVLATTASGVYGGGATGGVINIILRRDYAGVETRLTYENTFDTDSAGRRFDLSAGLSLEGGKTNVLLAASYSEGNPVLVQDRDFVQQGLAKILVNNPAAILPPNAPPRGYTTNIRSTNGSPLFGPGTPSFTYVPVGYAGGGGIEPLRANAGQYNYDLANIANANSGLSGIYRPTTIASLGGTVRRQFGPKVQMFFDSSWSETTSHQPVSRANISSRTIAANAPNNPFGQTITVTVPVVGAEYDFKTELESARIVAGVLVKLPADWTSEFDYTWTKTWRSHVQGGTGILVPPPAVITAITNGTIDVLKDTNLFPLDVASLVQPLNDRQHQVTSLNDYTLRLAGPIFKLPTGPVKVSALLERREEVVHEELYGVYGSNGVKSFSLIPEKSQLIDSAYLETQLPLVIPSMNIPAIHALDVQFAARHDRYSIDGTEGRIPTTEGSNVAIDRIQSEVSSTDPTIGLRWKPTRNLAIRGSFGTGFLPPEMNQLVPRAFAAIAASRVDPRRGNTLTGSIPGEGGGNPNLKPETSKSWSTGIVFEPARYPGWRLAVDYTRIEKRDNIVTLGSQDVVNYEAILGSDFVTRGPNLPGDPAGWAGPIIFLRTIPINLASAEVEAFDVALDGSFKIPALGTLDIAGIATWQTHYKTQLNSTAPIEENVGRTSSNPLKFKGNVSMTWTRGPWAAGWNVRYFDSYMVEAPTAASGLALIQSQGGNGRIPSQSYHDAYVRYRFGNGEAVSKLLRGTEVQIGINNVLNQVPPFDASAPFYVSGFGETRLATYVLSLKRIF